MFQLRKKLIKFKVMIHHQPNNKIKSNKCNLYLQILKNK